MAKSRQPNKGAMAAIVALCEAIPDESFVAVFPREPHPATRRLLESRGVMVGVSSRVEIPRAFTPAEFRRWLESQPPPSKA